MSQKLIKVFMTELDQLKDKDFRNIIEDMLIKLPDEVLDMPSASSGKFHPTDEIVSDGMIRHIKRCAVIADEIAKMRKHNDDERDILIAGSILHDIYKQGIKRTGHTVREHPIYVFDFMQKYLTKHKIKIVLDRKINSLSIACLLHEGQWTIPKAKGMIPKDTVHNDLQLGFSMHIVDYVASRRSIFEIMNPEYYDKKIPVLLKNEEDDDLPF